MPNKKLQIHDSLKRIENLFRWSGICLESNKQTANKNKIYKLLYLINFVSIHTVLIASIAWCIKSIADGIDFTEVTQVACFDVFILLGDIKSLSFLIYENSLHELMHALKNLEDEEHCRERADEINGMVKKETGFLNKVIKLFMFAMAMSGLFFAMQPAAAIVINYFRNHEVNVFLPILVVFPFDHLDIRFWPFAYLQQICLVAIIDFQVVVSDCMFFICCTYLQISFKILGHDFEEIIDKSDINSQFHITEEYEKKISSLVKRHQNILNAVTILEKIYTGSNLFNFLASALIICLNAFNITKLEENWLYIIAFLIFLSFSSAQIFLVCYFADMLIDQSMRVSDAVYNCKWYLAENSLVKDLQIVHLRAQTPCKITAYGFADVNLLAFSKIVKTSWSYFTLLNTVYSQGEH